MPIELTVTANFDAAFSFWNLQARQIPFAVALALTKTAQLVQDAERKEMLDVFDRPTPWTLNSVAIKPATKSDLRAVVFLKDAQATSGGTPADVYLTPEIRGGSRELKVFEHAFRSAGVLPSSHYMVPGAGAKLDQYGNLGRGQIVQLLAYFQAFGERGFTANTTAEGRRKLARGTRRTPGVSYFAVQPGASHLKPGIYRRTTTGVGRNQIMPIIMFVDSVHYEAIFDFAYVGETVVAKEFPRQLAAATAQAMATAR